jgi:hypothetical protein
MPKPAFNAGELVRLAESIRAAYVRQRQMRDPAFSTYMLAYWDGTGARYRSRKSIWPCLAQRAIEEEIDPVCWVEALFAEFPPFGSPPTPQDFYRRQVIQRARDWRQSKRRETVVRFDHELRNVQLARLERQRAGQLSDQEINRSLVCDGMLDLTPLAHWFVALTTGNLDVARSFLISAAIQYRECPEAYREVIGEHVHSLDPSF